jgi:hypothetical protein
MTPTPDRLKKDQSWRQKPLSLVQRARLIRLRGEDPGADMTAGDASDLYQATLAQMGMRCWS